MKLMEKIRLQFKKLCLHMYQEITFHKSRNVEIRVTDGKNTCYKLRNDILQIKKLHMLYE